MAFVFKNLFWLAFASSIALAQSGDPALPTKFEALPRKYDAVTSTYNAIEKPFVAVDGSTNSYMPTPGQAKTAVALPPSTFVPKQPVSAQSVGAPSLPDQFAPTPLFGPPAAAPHDYSQGNMISYPENPVPFGLSTGQSVPAHGTGPLQSTELFATPKELEDFQKRGATPGMLNLIQKAQLGTTVCRNSDRSVWSKENPEKLDGKPRKYPPCDASTKPSTEKKGHCYMYVKLALESAGCIPNTKVLPSGSAKDAVKDMSSSYFTRVAGKFTDPSQAPAGSIIVYDGEPDGHIEIKSYNNTYISDAIHGGTCMMPIIGVFLPHCDQGKL